MAPRTREIFKRLAACVWLSDFYLAGGTGLALQLGIALQLTRIRESWRS